MNSYLEILKRIGMGGNIPVSMGGSGMHPGMETGYQPVYGQQNPLPSGGLSNISTSTGAPMNKGIFGNIDWQQGITDLAGMSFPTEEAGEMISGGKVGGKGGPTLADVSLTNMGGGAPNPGWPLVHPRRKEEQYAGPFVPTQFWSLG